MSVFTNAATSSAEEADEYILALLELLGSRDPLQVLAGTADELAARTDALDDAQLARPERPGKWSIRHVLQHLADSELAWGWRLRMVLAHERPRITGYDQDLWAERLSYDQVEPSHALRDFATLRNSNLRLLRHASAEDLQRVGVHDERGEESVARMMELYAAHDLLHLKQIDRIREQLRE